MRSHVMTRWCASPLFKASVSALFALAMLATPMVYAQNLGTAPAFNQAVQGQQASAPEGAFKNLVDWIGNVICPVGAALAIVGTVVAWRSGRGYLPWALTAGGLLAVSGLTRLVEYFITNAQQVGTFVVPHLRYFC
jgi:hypothetical protein